ncbi:MAG: DUF6568 family protein [Bacilli bacterium]
MEKEKNIPLKNYIILAAILILTIILVIYFYMWYENYESTKLTSPIMDEYMQVINYNELNDYLVENKNSVIYVSVLDSKEIRNFELKFKKFIRDNSLDNSILYLNLTEELKDNKIVKELKNKYKLDDLDITNVPAIIIFKDGNITSIYNIKDDDYNIDKLKSYLEKERVIEDD